MRAEVLSNLKLIFFSLVLAFLTAAVYWEVRKADFVSYDDFLYITTNEHVFTGLSWDNIRWAFTAFYASNWHPLTWISLMLDAQLYGLNAAGFHWTNVLLHCANALLLFFVFLRMTNALWRSFFVAVLFALHPLHVESVAWVTERKDILSAFFFFLALGSYLSFTRSPNKTKYALIIFLFVLGLLAKPMLVTLPFVLILLDYWPLHRFRPKVILEKWPLFFLSFLSCVVTFLAQQRGGALINMDSFSLMTRLANSIVCYAEYLFKMIWPLNLAALYPYAEVPLWKLAGALFLLGAISCFVLWKFRKYPYLLTGWLWYLGMLIPVIGIVKFGSQRMADRYTYLPLTGIFIMTAWGLADWTARWKHQKIILGALSGVLLCALAFLTKVQTGYWQDSLTLYNHAIRVTKNNYIMHMNLGLYWASMKGFEKATEEYIDVIKLRRKADTIPLMNDFGNHYATKEGWQDALAFYSAVLHENPDFAPAHFNSALVLEKMGKGKEAVKHYQEVLRLIPHHEQASKNLSQLLQNVPHPTLSPLGGEEKGEGVLESKKGGVG